jgi:sec-independent protein translocase protein TatC
VIVTAPFWLYQLWAFVVPGLLAKERKWALIFVAAAGSWAV